MARRKSTARSREKGIGKLEANVDAVLMAAGLELNKSLDKLVEQSKRRRPFPIAKARKGKKLRRGRRTR